MKNQVFIFSIVFYFLFVGNTLAQSSRSVEKKSEVATEEFRYELECAGEGSKGTYLVKVSSYFEIKSSKIIEKVMPTISEESKKNAVHGILFKGYDGGSGQKCRNQGPIVTGADFERKQAKFLKSFFEDGGLYMKYVTTSNDAKPTSIIKMGKKMYKISMIVSVKKDDLRKYLEDNNIIRGLTSGF